MKLDFSRIEFDHLLWDEAWVKWDEDGVDSVLGGDKQSTLDLKWTLKRLFEYSTTGAETSLDRAGQFGMFPVLPQRDFNFWILEKCSEHGLCGMGYWYIFFSKFKYLTVYDSYHVWLIKLCRSMLLFRFLPIRISDRYAFIYNWNIYQWNN